MRASIEAAFAQTWSPLEILLSDDCSPDGTFAVMQEMAAAYSGPHRVILNRNPKNLGITAHVDRIMELTSGDFVVQNAGDDVATPDRTSKLVAAWLASGRRAKAIHSARRRLDEAGGLHEVIDDGPRILAGMTPLEVIRDHGTLVGASLGWDRDLWRVFGPLGPTPIFDDFPTAFRASLIGEIAYLAEPLLHYRMGGTSSRPQGDFGHNYLYGFRIKDLRWHRSFWARLPRGDGGRRPARRRGVPAALRGEDRRGRLRDRPRRDPLVAAAAAAAGERGAEPRPPRPDATCARPPSTCWAALRPPPRSRRRARRRTDVAA